MIAAILISLTMMTGCTGNVEEYELYFQTAGVDTVGLADFRGEISYRYDGDHQIDFILRIFEDEQEVLATADYEIGLYNFSNDSLLTEYTMDLDGDGTREFILHCNGGGQQCCNDIIVYGLEERPILIDSVYCETPLAELEDLDGDDIPEIFCGDDWFKGWKAHPSISPGLRLVWKWDGSKYRLANFDFADFLLHKAPKWWDDKIPPPDTTKDLYYDPQSPDPKFPPVQLWGKMLVYIYTGEPDKADSLFDGYWPDRIPGKEEFYRDFRQYLEKSRYWQQLQDSDW